MDIENIKPADIERRSMEIIESELGKTPWLTEQERIILKRVIHTSADFEYKDNLKFSPNAVNNALAALLEGAVIITDTQMALSGISKPALKALGCEAHCFMSDEDVAAMAKAKGLTRAVISMNKAAELYAERRTIFAIGNAPTALIRIHELINEGRIKPDLVIGVPVGFVNVVQSKKIIMSDDVNYIVGDGRKGGSNVAAAICNALLYQIYERK